MRDRGHLPANPTTPYLEHMRKWHRRDLYFYGSLAMLFTGLGGWNVWLAMHGSPWSWLGAAFDECIVALYVRGTRRAFARWQDIEERLRPPAPE